MLWKRNAETGKDVTELKQRLKNNWTLKLASVAIAFLIWLVVGNINDPIIQKVYSNVKVSSFIYNLKGTLIEDFSIDTKELGKKEILFLFYYQYGICQRKLHFSYF